MRATLNSGRRLLSRLPKPHVAHALPSVRRAWSPPLHSKSPAALSKENMTLPKETTPSNSSLYTRQQASPSPLSVGANGHAHNSGELCKITNAKAFLATLDAAANVLPVVSHRSGVKLTFNDYKTTSEAAFDERALFVKDLGVVDRQLQRWEREMPGIAPFYAVKCNPDPVLIASLAAQGSGFDCASRKEIELVLSTGVPAERIVFANPVKSVGDLRFANEAGVRKMTFDNEQELDKVAQHCPQAQLLLRLLPDDTGSRLPFGVKFGAAVELTPRLMERCAELELTLIGVSFHVGSGCFDSSKFADAVKLCRGAFDTAASLGLPPLTMVDIGGGFPGSTPETTTRAMSATIAGAETPEEARFEELARSVQCAFARHFPPTEFPHLRRIAEPGRYFGHAFGTLFLRVQGRRLVGPSPSPSNSTTAVGGGGASKTEGPGQERFLYYVNDGVYGSFNCKLYDAYHPIPVTLEEYFDKEKDANAITESVLDATTTKTPKTGMAKGTFFGPTCDSLDKIVEDHAIRELQVGEYVVFDDMGAYTNAAATEFNGCRLAVTRYIRSLMAD